MVDKLIKGKNMLNTMFFGGWCCGCGGCATGSAMRVEEGVGLG